jgi:D-serine deaminase-like pyridoxal phosphate-dependent protein
MSPALKRRDDIKLYAREEVMNLVKAKELLENNGIHVKYLSGGSSVTSVCPEEFAPLTESRAGNYVFYDVNYVDFSSMSNLLWKNAGNHWALSM